MGVWENNRVPVCAGKIKSPVPEEDEEETNPLGDWSRKRQLIHLWRPSWGQRLHDKTLGELTSEQFDWNIVWWFIRVGKKRKLTPVQPGIPTHLTDFQRHQSLNVAASLQFILEKKIGPKQVHSQEMWRLHFHNYISLNSGNIKNKNLTSWLKHSSNKFHEC